MGHETSTGSLLRDRIFFLNILFSSHLAHSTYAIFIDQGDGDGAGASAVVLPRALGAGKKSGMYVYRWC